MSHPGHIQSQGYIFDVWEILLLVRPRVNHLRAWPQAKDIQDLYTIIRSGGSITVDIDLILVINFVGLRRSGLLPRQFDFAVSIDSLHRSDYRQFLYPIKICKVELITPITKTTYESRVYLSSQAFLNVIIASQLSSATLSKDVWLSIRTTMYLNQKL